MLALLHRRSLAERRGGARQPWPYVRYKGRQVVQRVCGGHGVTGRGDFEPVGKRDRAKDQKLAPYSHTSQLIHPSSHEEHQSYIIHVYDDSSTTSR